MFNGSTKTHINISFRCIIHLIKIQTCWKYLKSNEKKRKKDKGRHSFNFFFSLLTNYTLWLHWIIFFIFKLLSCYYVYFLLFSVIPATNKLDMTIWPFLQTPRVQEEENPYSSLMPKNMTTQKSDERKDRKGRSREEWFWISAG